MTVTPRSGLYPALRPIFRLVADAARIVMATALFPVLFNAAGEAVAATVSAGQAEAKNAAKNANCTPTKVEVMKYAPGRMQQTVFKISCSEDKDAFVVVSCRARNCAVMF